MFHTLFDYQDQNIDNNYQIPKDKEQQSEKYPKDSIPHENYYGKGNKAYELYNKNNKNETNDINEKFEKTKNKINLYVYKNGFIINDGKFRDISIPENKKFMEEVERGTIPNEIAKTGINDLGILLINRKTEIYNSKKNNLIIKEINEKKPKKINISHDLNIDKKRAKSPQITKKKTKKFIKRAPSSNNIYQFNKEGEEEEDKKFEPFSGIGKKVGNVNLKGLHFDKEYKNKIDCNQPFCTISIRLFNGEISKAQFNYSQTLRDIYLYVKRISGATKFYLLDGFPPKPLRDYNKMIYELQLKNTILTQKLNI